MIVSPAKRSAPRYPSWMRLVSLIVVQIFVFDQVAFAAPGGAAASNGRSIFSGKQAAHEAVQQRNLCELMHKKGMQEDQSQETSHKLQAGVTPGPISLSALRHLSALRIPAEDGQILEVWQPSEETRDTLQVTSGSDPLRAPTVIILQDLHTQPDAQRAEGRILEHLYQTYRIRHVAVEGAEGPLSVEFFKQFPRQKTVRDAIAESFLELGEMLGTERAVVTQQLPVALYGIEDAALHARHTEAYRETLAAAPRAQEVLSRIEGALEALTPKMYSEELLAFDAQRRRFADGDVSLEEYAALLDEAAGRHGLSLNGMAPNVARFLELRTLEAALNQEQAQAELQALVEAASADASAAGPLQELLQAFQQGTVGAAHFYSELASLAARAQVDVAAYPAVQQFQEYVRLTQAMQSHNMLAELDTVEWAVIKALAESGDVWRLAASLRHVRLLQDLFNLRLTTEHLAYYRAHRDELTLRTFQAFLDKQLARHKIRMPVEYPADAVDAPRVAAERFYELAEQRDLALAERTLAWINGVAGGEPRDASAGRPDAEPQAAVDGRPAAVLLVAGGFHTAGMTRIFRERQVPYVVVTPTASGEVNEARYHRLINGQTADLEELLAVAQTQYAQRAGRIAQRNRPTLQAAGSVLSGLFTTRNMLRVVSVTLILSLVFLQGDAQAFDFARFVNDAITAVQQSGLPAAEAQQLSEILRATFLDHADAIRSMAEQANHDPHAFVKLFQNSDFYQDALRQVSELSPGAVETLSTGSTVVSTEAAALVAGVDVDALQTADVSQMAVAPIALNLGTPSNPDRRTVSAPVTVDGGVAFDAAWPQSSELGATKSTDWGSRYDDAVTMTDWHLDNQAVVWEMLRAELTGRGFRRGDEITVMDFGAGPGTSTPQMVYFLSVIMGLKVRIVAVDNSQSNQARNRERMIALYGEEFVNANVRFYIQDTRHGQRLTDVIGRDNRVDLIVSMNTMHLVPDDADLFGQFRDVLSERGFALAQSGNVNPAAGETRSENVFNIDSTVSMARAEALKILQSRKDLKQVLDQLQIPAVQRTFWYSALEVSARQEIGKASHELGYPAPRARNWYQGAVDGAGLSEADSRTEIVDVDFNDWRTFLQINGEWILAEAGWRQRGGTQMPQELADLRRKLGAAEAALGQPTAEELRVREAVLNLAISRVYQQLGSSRRASGTPENGSFQAEWHYMVLDQPQSYNSTTGAVVDLGVFGFQELGRLTPMQAQALVDFAGNITPALDGKALGGVSGRVNAGHVRRFVSGVLERSGKGLTAEQIIRDVVETLKREASGLSASSALENAELVEASQRYADDYEAALRGLVTRVVGMVLDSVKLAENADYREWVKALESPGAGSLIALWRYGALRGFLNTAGMSGVDMVALGADEGAALDRLFDLNYPQHVRRWSVDSSVRLALFDRRKALSSASDGSFATVASASRVDLDADGQMTNLSRTQGVGASRTESGSLVAGQRILVIGDQGMNDAVAALRLRYEEASKGYEKDDRVVHVSWDDPAVQPGRLARTVQEGGFSFVVVQDNAAMALTPASVKSLEPMDVPVLLVGSQADIQAGLLRSQAAAQEPDRERGGSEFLPNLITPKPSQGAGGDMISGLLSSVNLEFQRDSKQAALMRRGVRERVIIGNEMLLTEMREVDGKVAPVTISRRQLPVSALSVKAWFLLLWAFVSAMWGEHTLQDARHDFRIARSLLTVRRVLPRELQDPLNQQNNPLNYLRLVERDGEFLSSVISVDGRRLKLGGVETGATRLGLHTLMTQQQFLENPYLAAGYIYHEYLASTLEQPEYQEKRDYAANYQETIVRDDRELDILQRQFVEQRFGSTWAIEVHQSIRRQHLTRVRETGGRVTQIVVTESDEIRDESLDVTDALLQDSDNGRLLVYQNPDNSLDLYVYRFPIEIDRKPDMEPTLARPGLPGSMVHREAARRESVLIQGLLDESSPGAYSLSPTQLQQLEARKAALDTELVNPPLRVAAADRLQALFAYLGTVDVEQIETSRRTTLVYDWNGMVLTVQRRFTEDDTFLDFTLQSSDPAFAALGPLDGVIVLLERERLSGRGEFDSYGRGIIQFSNGSARVSIPAKALSSATFRLRVDGLEESMTAAEKYDSAGRARRDFRHLVSGIRLSPSGGEVRFEEPKVASSSARTRTLMIEYATPTLEAASPDKSPAQAQKISLLPTLTVTVDSDAAARAIHGMPCVLTDDSGRPVIWGQLEQQGDTNVLQAAFPDVFTADMIEIFSGSRAGWPSRLVIDAPNAAADFAAGASQSLPAKSSGSIAVPLKIGDRFEAKTPAGDIVQMQVVNQFGKTAPVLRIDTQQHSVVRLRNQQGFTTFLRLDLDGSEFQQRLALVDQGGAVLAWLRVSRREGGSLAVHVWDVNGITFTKDNQPLADYASAQIQEEIRQEVQTLLTGMSPFNASLGGSPNAPVGKTVQKAEGRYVTVEVKATTGGESLPHVQNSFRHNLEVHVTARELQQDDMWMPEQGKQLVADALDGQQFEVWTEGNPAQDVGGKPAVMTMERGAGMGADAIGRVAMIPAGGVLLRVTFRVVAAAVVLAAAYFGVEEVLQQGIGQAGGLIALAPVFPVTLPQYETETERELSAETHVARILNTMPVLQFDAREPFHWSGVSGNYRIELLYAAPSQEQFMRSERNPVVIKVFHNDVILSLSDSMITIFNRNLPSGEQRLKSVNLLVDQRFQGVDLFQGNDKYYGTRLALQIHFSDSPYIGAMVGGHEVIEETKDGYVITTSGARIHKDAIEKIHANARITGEHTVIPAGISEIADGATLHNVIGAERMNIMAGATLIFVRLERDVEVGRNNSVMTNFAKRDNYPWSQKKEHNVRGPIDEIDPDNLDNPNNWTMLREGVRIVDAENKNRRSELTNVDIGARTVIEDGVIENCRIGTDNELRHVRMPTVMTEEQVRLVARNPRIPLEPSNDILEAGFFADEQSLIDAHRHARGVWTRKWDTRQRKMVDLDPQSANNKERDRAARVQNYLKMIALCYTGDGRVDSDFTGDMNHTRFPYEWRTINGKRVKVYLTNKVDGSGSSSHGWFLAAPFVTMLKRLRYIAIQKTKRPTGELAEDFYDMDMSVAFPFAVLGDPYGTRDVNTDAWGPTPPFALRQGLSWDDVTFAWVLNQSPDTVFHYMEALYNHPLTVDAAKRGDFDYFVQDMIELGRDYLMQVKYLQEQRMAGMESGPQKDKLQRLISRLDRAIDIYQRHLDSGAWIFQNGQKSDRWAQNAQGQWWYKASGVGKKDGLSLATLAQWACQEATGVTDGSAAAQYQQMTFVEMTTRPDPMERSEADHYPEQIFREGDVMPIQHDYEPPPNTLSDPQSANPNATIDPTAVICEGAVIEDGAYIGAGAIIGPRAVIRVGAVVGANSVVEEGAEVKAGAQVVGASRIGKGVTVEERALVHFSWITGEHSVVRKGAVLLNVMAEYSDIGENRIIGSSVIRGHAQENGMVVIHGHPEAGKAGELWGFYIQQQADAPPGAKTELPAGKSGVHGIIINSSWKEKGRDFDPFAYLTNVTATYDNYLGSPVYNSFFTGAARSHHLMTRIHFLQAPDVYFTGADEKTYRLANPTNVGGGSQTNGTADGVVTSLGAFISTNLQIGKNVTLGYMTIVQFRVHAGETVPDFTFTRGPGRGNHELGGMTRRPSPLLRTTDKVYGEGDMTPDEKAHAGQGNAARMRAQRGKFGSELTRRQRELAGHPGVSGMTRVEPGIAALREVVGNNIVRVTYLSSANRDKYGVRQTMSRDFDVQESDGAAALENMIRLGVGGEIVDVHIVTKTSGVVAIPTLNAQGHRDALSYPGPVDARNLLEMLLTGGVAVYRNVPLGVRVVGWDLAARDNPYVYYTEAQLTQGIGNLSEDVVRRYEQGRELNFENGRWIAVNGANPVFEVDPDTSWIMTDGSQGSVVQVGEAAFTITGIENRPDGHLTIHVSTGGYQVETTSANYRDDSTLGAFSSGTWTAPSNASITLTKDGVEVARVSVRRVDGGFKLLVFPLQESAPAIAVVPPGDTQRLLAVVRTAQAELRQAVGAQPIDHTGQTPGRVPAQVAEFIWNAMRLNRYADEETGRSPIIGPSDRAHERAAEIFFGACEQLARGDDPEYDLGFMAEVMGWLGVLAQSEAQGFQANDAFENADFQGFFQGQTWAQIMVEFKEYLRNPQTRHPRTGQLYRELAVSGLSAYLYEIWSRWEAAGAWNAYMTPAKEAEIKQKRQETATAPVTQLTIVVAGASSAEGQATVEELRKMKAGERDAAPLRQMLEARGLDRNNLDLVQIIEVNENDVAQENFVQTFEERHGNVLPRAVIIQKGVFGRASADSQDAPAVFQAHVNGSLRLMEIAGKYNAEMVQDPLGNIDNNAQTRNNQMMQNPTTYTGAARTVSALHARMAQKAFGMGLTVAQIERTMQADQQLHIGEGAERITLTVNSEVNTPEGHLFFHVQAGEGMQMKLLSGHGTLSSAGAANEGFWTAEEGSILSITNKAGEEVARVSVRRVNDRFTIRVEPRKGQEVGDPSDAPMLWEDAFTVPADPAADAELKRRAAVRQKAGRQTVESKLFMEGFEAFWAFVGNWTVTVTYTDEAGEKQTRTIQHVSGEPGAQQNYNNYEWLRDLLLYKKDGKEDKEKGGKVVGVALSAPVYVAQADGGYAEQLPSGPEGAALIAMVMTGAVPVGEVRSVGGGPQIVAFENGIRAQDATVQRYARYEGNVLMALNQPITVKKANLKRLPNGVAQEVQGHEALYRAEVDVPGIGKQPYFVAIHKEYFWEKARRILGRLVPWAGRAKVSLGGNRFWPYAFSKGARILSDEEAERAAMGDALRLSRGMTFKALMAGLGPADRGGVGLGGGKAVTVQMKPVVSTQEKAARLAPFWRFVAGLSEHGHAYISAEDVGLKPADVEFGAEISPETTTPSEFLPAEPPSEFTALGIDVSMEVAIEQLIADGKLELVKHRLMKANPDKPYAGLTVLLQGVGNVGLPQLIDYLVKKGANVVVSDSKEAQLAVMRQQLQARYPGKTVETESTPETINPILDRINKGELEYEGKVWILDDYKAVSQLHVRIYMPTALGGTVTTELLDAMKDHLVAIIGSANNQLPQVPEQFQAAADKLKEYDVLYGPDWVINSGGLIDVVAQTFGYNAAEWIKHKVRENFLKIIAYARDHKISTAEAAQALVAPMLEEALRISAEREQAEARRSRMTARPQPIERYRPFALEPAAAAQVLQANQNKVVTDLDPLSAAAAVRTFVTPDLVALAASGQIIVYQNKETNWLAISGLEEVSAAVRQDVAELLKEFSRQSMGVSATQAGKTIYDSGVSGRYVRLKIEVGSEQGRISQSMDSGESFAQGYPLILTIERLPDQSEPSAERIAMALDGQMIQMWSGAERREEDMIGSWTLHRPDDSRKREIVAAATLMVIPFPGFIHSLGLTIGQEPGEARRKVQADDMTAGAGTQIEYRRNLTKPEFTRTDRNTLVGVRTITEGSGQGALEAIGTLPPYSQRIAVRKDIAIYEMSDKEGEIFQTLVFAKRSPEGQWVSTESDPSYVKDKVDAVRIRQLFKDLYQGTLNQVDRSGVINKHAEVVFIYVTVNGEEAKRFTGEGGRTTLATRFIGQPVLTLEETENEILMEGLSAHEAASFEAQVSGKDGMQQHRLGLEAEKQVLNLAKSDPNRWSRLTSRQKGAVTQRLNVIELDLRAPETRAHDDMASGDLDWTDDTMTLREQAPAEAGVEERLMAMVPQMTTGDFVQFPEALREQPAMTAAEVAALTRGENRTDTAATSDGSTSGGVSAAVREGWSTVETAVVLAFSDVSKTTMSADELQAVVAGMLGKTADEVEVFVVLSESDNTPDNRLQLFSNGYQGVTAEELKTYHNISVKFYFSTEGVPEFLPFTLTETIHYTVDHLNQLTPALFEEMMADQMRKHDFSPEEFLKAARMA